MNFSCKLSTENVFWCNALSPSSLYNIDFTDNFLFTFVDVAFTQGGILLYKL
jgi:hypothetical protein